MATTPGCSEALPFLSRFRVTINTMEPPIQLTFFKKLELYQELHSQNTKADGRDNTWLLEKALLQWTVHNHHHLGSPLVEGEAINRILRESPALKRVEYDDGLIRQAMKNLIEREYADDVSLSDSHEEITFSRLGRLMGEVIEDVEGEGAGTWMAWRYPFFIKFVWGIAVLGGLLVIINCLEQLGSISHSLFAHHDGRWYNGY